MLIGINLKLPNPNIEFGGSNFRFLALRPTLLCDFTANGDGYFLIEV